MTLIEFRALGLMGVGGGIELAAQLAGLGTHGFCVRAQLAGFILARLQEGFETISALVGGGQLLAREPQAFLQGRGARGGGLCLLDHLRLAHDNRCLALREFSVSRRGFAVDRRIGAVERGVPQTLQRFGHFVRQLRKFPPRDVP